MFSTTYDTVLGECFICWGYRRIDHIFDIFTGDNRKVQGLVNMVARVGLPKGVFIGVLGTIWSVGFDRGIEKVSFGLSNLDQKLMTLNTELGYFLHEYSACWLMLKYELKISTIVPSLVVVVNPFFASNDTMWKKPYFWIIPEFKLSEIASWSSSNVTTSFSCVLSPIVLSIPRFRTTKAFRCIDCIPRHFTLPLVSSFEIIHCKPNFLINFIASCKGIFSKRFSNLKLN